VDIEKLDQIGSDVAMGRPDDLSRQEESKFSADATRYDEKKQVIHVAFIWFIRVAAFVMIIVFVVRMVHFILPEKYCWLSAEQIQGLDKFLFSGALGGLVVGSIKQAFGTKD
jgi:hypothetical protein